MEHTREEAAETRREQLREQLRTSREYREQYGTSALIDTVSKQAAALRRQRGLTQGDLAEMMGTKQPRVSNIEAPPDGDKIPNWGLDTLNRMAHALECRLKITFETYGSLVPELDSLTSDSLRRFEPEHDPILNPVPEAMPTPDQNASERVRWMQKLMIPWLWEDKLGLETLVNWLQGYGLPPVGYDEDPSQWLLRGIPSEIDDSLRNYLERKLAERLAIVLGEQPDLYPMVKDRPEEFLISLYSVCAGLRCPAFLAEPIWQTYRRLNQSKLSKPVRHALQAAMMSNQEDDKAQKAVWWPMVTKGKHRWFPGTEITGFEGLVARRSKSDEDYQLVYEALAVISKRWSGTAEDRMVFHRLINSVPDFNQIEVANGLVQSAGSWSEWAKELLPSVSKVHGIDGSIDIFVRLGDTEYFANWQPGKPARTGIRLVGSTEERNVEEWHFGNGKPDERLLMNVILTMIGGASDDVTIDQALAYSQISNGIVSRAA